MLYEDQQISSRKSANQRRELESKLAILDEDANKLKRVKLELENQKRKMKKTIEINKLELEKLLLQERSFQQKLFQLEDEKMGLKKILNKLIVQIKEDGF